jgi:hypothetical protein
MPIRRAIASVLVTAIPLALHAQGPNSLRGRVVDETNRAISFAQISVTPGGRRLVTDRNGDFEIRALDNGEVRLDVRRIGFEPTRVTLSLPREEGRLTIALRALPRVLDSVRVRERAPEVRFTGIVVDDLDQPIVDAEVIAAGASDMHVRTDSGGHFRLMKAQKGTIVLRVRKFGYAPYFGSLTLQAEREDTLRMKRHPTDLPEAYIRAESGWGRDSFAYIELDSRTRWKLSNGGTASREDLDPWTDMNLCQALMRTPLAGKMGLNELGCSVPRCILIDGLQPVRRPLNLFDASEVEAFEFHRKDWSGTLASRIQAACGGLPPRDVGGMVIWLRKRPT